MKRRAFTLVEVVVAFAIFLIALIPINQLMRSNTRLMYRDSTEIVSTIGTNGGVIQNDEELYESILEDLRQQAEWAGYNYLKEIATTGTGKRTYTFAKGAKKGCPTGNDFYLSGSNGIDRINMDPFQPNNGVINESNTDYKCYLNSTFENTPLNKKITLTVKMGEAKNLRTIPSGLSSVDAIPDIKTAEIKNQPIIYGVLQLDSPDIKRKFVLTPFQERCFDFNEK